MYRTEWVFTFGLFLIFNGECYPEKCLFELTRNYLIRCHIFGKDTRFITFPDHSNRLWSP